MHAAVVNAIDQLPKFQNFADPVAGEGEIVVEIHAAGLHPIVKALASGQHYSGKGQVPLIPGVDGVGKLPDGRLHYCFASRPPFGTMAQQTVVGSKNCIPLPENLEPTQAAAIANPGMSAWLSLKLRAGLAAGETVLVNGATGVAGQLAVQAARYLGARKVIATGRNMEVLTELGADAVVALTNDDAEMSPAFAAAAEGGIDVVIDYLWGHPTELLLGALAKAFRPEGSKPVRLVEVGESAGKTIALPGAVLRSIDLTMCGSGFGSVPLAEIIQVIPTLFSLAADGHLKVAVEPVPLAKVEEAWGQGEKGKRIVFTM